MTSVLVAGAGGFIGHHLASFLKGKKYWVPGVDIKHPQSPSSSGGTYRLVSTCERASR